MSAICLLDTSVFCEILEVPGMHRDAPGHRTGVQERVQRGETLFLPMTVIVETGNHIGQNGDGTVRRSAAKRFVAQVEAAVNGTAPYTATRMGSPEDLLAWLAKFPDWVQTSDPKGKGSGFGDLSIVEEWNTLCARFSARRVYVWSLDAHLSGYDRAAPR